jgi:3-hydroxymyristoyl/3-hydroxydecanoyl-(acyl carrier protein) dehydratase
MTSAAFPHAYPFRFVDTVSQRESSGAEGGALGRVRIRVTANARASMGEGWQSTALYPEAIAQAALLLEGGDAETGRRGYLAGVSDLSMERAPRAGETLEISIRMGGRFGAMFRFDGEVRGGDAGDEILARGSVLVRKGDQAAEAAS